MVATRRRAALDRLLKVLLVVCLGAALLPPSAPAVTAHQCRCARAGTLHECDCPHCHESGARASSPAEPAAETPPCHRGRGPQASQGAGAPGGGEAAGAAPGSPRGASREATRPDAPCVSGGCGEGQVRLLPHRSIDEFVLPAAAGAPPARVGPEAGSAPAQPPEHLVSPELPPPRRS